MAEIPTQIGEGAGDAFQFKVVRGAIPDGLLQVAQSYFRLKLSNGLMVSDPLIPTSRGCMMNDTLNEAIIEYLTPMMEKACGKKLFPSYSHMRVYGPGSSLHPHTDRPSSEFACTVCIGMSTDKPWPIHVRRKKEGVTPNGGACDPEKDGVGKTYSVDLYPGDCLIYHGQNMIHWRDQYEGEEQTQCFLMWVAQNGKWASHKFDKRPQLGYIRFQKPAMQIAQNIDRNLSVVEFILGHTAEMAFRKNHPYLSVFLYPPYAALRFFAKLCGLKPHGPIRQEPQTREELESKKDN